MAITRLAFQLQDGDNYIDLAKALSLHHRTLVRQKQIFTVMGGMLADNSDEDLITVSTAPNTWYTRAAVNRAFKAWKNMRSKALANAEDTSGTGKFADFKVYLNAGGSGSYREAIATGQASARLELQDREWTYSSLEDETGNDVQIQIVGPHNAGASRYSATTGWINTRAQPNDANEPTMPDNDGNGTLDYKEDFINLMHDQSDGRPERLALAYEENDDSPYALDHLYGTTSSNYNLQLQCAAYTQKTSQVMIPGFEALCGLIHVHVGSGATNPFLFLDVESRGRKF